MNNTDTFIRKNNICVGMVQTKSQKEYYENKSKDPEWVEENRKRKREYYQEKMKDPKWVEENRKHRREIYQEKRKDPKWRERRNTLQRNRWVNIDHSVKQKYGDKTKQNKNNNKLILINEHGGKCVMCGYNKNFSALDFHHDSDKDRENSISNLLYNLDKARIEAKDCILLCANCHRELHNPKCNIN